MTEKFQNIIVWYHSDKNYQAGLLLLAKYGRNTALLRNLMKPGKEKFGGHKKLTSQLAKIAGFNTLNPPVLPKELKDKSVIKLVSTSDPNSNLISCTSYQNSKIENENEYPKVIRRIKYEYQEKYTHRSILFKQMLAVPDNNKPENMKARSLLLKEMNEETDRMEFLYAFIKAYQTNQSIPNEEIVWPVVKSSTKLPDNVDELKSLKKKLGSSNTKDKNLLLYQHVSKQKKENPLMDGPMKTKIQNRIKIRLSKIDAINKKLLKTKYAN